MSYEKVKSIKIDEKQGKVFITCACNNVRPLTYDKAEFSSLSKILKEKGKEEVEVQILKIYEEGSFQQGTNKFTKAFKVMIYVFGDEYSKFDWRTNNAKYGSKEDKEHRDLRESKEFKNFLRKCLKYKLPKEKFVLAKKVYMNEDLAYGKACMTCLKWLYDKGKATKFDFRDEAERYLSYYKNLTNVEIVEV